MRTVLMFLVLCSFSLASLAQIENIGDYEIKVISYTYKTTKGRLKKVNAEGIGIEDYKGNYIIYRTADIIRIKVRKSGLTLGKSVAGGTLFGAGLGGTIWSLDESGQNMGDMAKLTALLTVTGAVVGTAVGGIVELSNTKLTLKVKGRQEYFKKNYQKLEKYAYY